MSLRFGCRLARLAIAPSSPPNLQLRILDADDDPVMQAEARSTEAIQLKFEAAMGEQFSIQVALGDLTLTEQFEV